MKLIDTSQRFLMSHINYQIVDILIQAASKFYKASAAEYAEFA